MSHTTVQEALKAGAEPAMLCATCPWDRFCVEPPTMTADDVEQDMQKAKERDERELAKAKAEGGDPGLPIGTLLTALTSGGRDRQAQVCPVFALRLRSGGGRRIVDTIKGQMEAWDDES